MKKISIVVPCYNEEENVEPLSEAIIREFAENLPGYDYEIIFIDNDSKDQTRTLLRGLCEKNKKIKAIFNAKNFGQFNSPYYGLLQATGDCGILLAADFQDPVEMIHQFVAGWEEGFKIVIGIKTQSKENKLMYALRGLYYKLIKRFSDVEQIEQFTGFGLYDKKFIQVLRDLDDPTPFLRGVVAELGFRRKEIPYTQPLRRAGKTSNNFYRLYDAAMLSVTSYTKVGLRVASFIGMIGCVLSMILAVVYLVFKLIYWDRFPAGMAPMLIGMCVLGSIQLFFIGMIGEYILSINSRVMKRPLVIEEERINFSRKNNRNDNFDRKQKHEWTERPERSYGMENPNQSRKNSASKEARGEFAGKPQKTGTPEKSKTRELHEKPYEKTRERSGEKKYRTDASRRNYSEGTKRPVASLSYSEYEKAERERLKKAENTVEAEPASSDAVQQ